MKTKLLTTILFCTITIAIVQAQCESVSSGNWTDNGTWTNCGGSIPTSTDVIVNTSHRVALNNNDNVDLNGNVTVKNGSQLLIADSKSNWTGDIFVEDGGFLVLARKSNSGFNLNGDITVAGTMTVNAEYSMNGNVTIKSTGFMNLNDKLNMGSGSGCGNIFSVESGGSIYGDNASERLNICGNQILKGGSTGSCNDINASPDPGPDYCLDGTIYGPLGLDEFGKTTALNVNFSNFQLNGGNDENVEVVWSTSFENNSSHFIIEGSYNGNDFSEVETIYSNNNFGGSEYSALVDDSYSYYRVVEVDLDGTEKSTKIISNQASFEVSLFPNPAKDILNVKGEGNLTVQILTLDNQSVLFTEIDESGIIELNNLEPAIYMVIITNGSSTTHHRLIKE